MSTIIVTHSEIDERGIPEEDALGRLCHETIIPRLNGINGIVTTGVLRTDLTGERLSRLTGIDNLRVVPELGPLRSWPVPSFCHGQLYYSLLRYPPAVRLVFYLASKGWLPCCEYIEGPFRKRTLIGVEIVRNLGPSVVIAHRETAAVIMAEAKSTTVLRAAMEGIPHSHVIEIP